MVVMEKTIVEYHQKVLTEEQKRAYEEEDQMTLAQFSQSRQSSTFNTPKPISVVTFNQGDTPSRQNSALLDHDKARRCARERAEEVQANLDPRFPSFVKIMLKSHVTGGFWLGLPASFCNLHLPKHDVSIILVDENEGEYPTKFLAEKTGLSAGWRGFSIAHDLVEGDALVFHLVEKTRFQVYIIKAYCLGVIDGALGLFSSDSHPKRASQSKCKTKEKTRKRRKTCRLAALQLLDDDKSGSTSEEVNSEVLEDTRVSRNTVEFQDVTSVENLPISVNNVMIDSEISPDVKMKYYKLCSSQGAFLHKDLLEHLNTKFAAGAISETVDIVDAIKACKLSTFQHDFLAWDKSLVALEQLGMNVSFLRARLEQLKSIVFDSEVDSKRCDEAQVKLTDTEKEIQTLKAKVAELEAASNMLYFETETLKAKNIEHEQRFQLEVGSLCLW